MDPTTKKRPTTVRATPSQVETLRNAFALSTTTSKDLLKRLSEETGLSVKWIVAWYSRQRKKRTRDSGDTGSDPAMLPEEIANFKTEYREPVLENSIDTASAGMLNDEKRRVKPPVEKRRRGRPPKPKVKAEQHDAQMLSNRPSSPSSASVAIDSNQLVSRSDLCSSNFIRPIAPRTHLPPSFQPRQPSISLHLVPNLHGHPHSSIPPGVLGVLNYDYHAGSPSLQHALQPVAYTNTGSQNHIPTNSVRDPLEKSLHLASLVDENSPFCTAVHSLHPIARRIPYPSRATQWPSRPSAASVSNDPQFQRNILASLAQLAKLPLFTRNVLSFSHSLAGPHNNADASSMKNPIAYSATPEPPMLSTASNPSPWPMDPSRAPLKHLTILQSFENDYNKDMSTAFDTADLMIDRLLDERLAEDDPFQATMGLVFLSQLGLEWEYE